MAETKIALTIGEASEYTGIGRNTMRNLVEWGKTACPESREKSPYQK